MTHCPHPKDEQRYERAKEVPDIKLTPVKSNPSFTGAYGEWNGTGTLPEIIVDIHTKKGLESYQIAQCFTGKVVLCFNQGGLAGCEKHETLKKVVKLK